MNGQAIVIPQVTIASAPAVEVRVLGDGKRIFQEQMLDELNELSATVEPGYIWRPEKRHELVALMSPYSHKNAKGAYSVDDSIEPGWYWADETTPWGGRVVVGFGYGLVYDGDGSGYARAFARAVRGSGP